MSATESLLIRFAESGAGQIIGRIDTILGKVRALNNASGKEKIIDANFRAIDPAKDQAAKLAERMKAYRDQLKAAAMAEALFRRNLRLTGVVIRNVAGEFNGMVESARNVALTIAGLTAAAIKGTIEVSKIGGAVIGSETLFKRTSNAVGEMSEALLTKMRDAAAGTISDLGLMSAANFAFLGGAKLTAEEIEVLVQASTKLSAAGIQVHGRIVTAEEAMRRFTDAIIKQERRLVDDLTVVIKAKDVLDDYAASVGKSKDALSAEEKVFAFKNAIVAQARERLTELVDVQIGAATVGQRASVAFENFANSIAKTFVQGGFAERVLERVNAVLGGLMERLSDPAQVDAFFGGIVNGIGRLIDMTEVLLDIVIRLAPYLDRIISAFTAGTLGAGVGGLIGSVVGSVVPGAGTIAGGVIGTAIGGGLGAAGGFAFGGTEVGREVGGALKPSFAERDRFMTDLSRQVRNQTMMPNVAPVGP